LYNQECVRRTDLEQRLRKLGWAPSGKGSGRNHRVWAHPDREFELYVPQYDLIPDAVGQRILKDAEE
jgi:hypothetical protein